MQADHFLSYLRPVKQASTNEFDNKAGQITGVNSSINDNLSEALVIQNLKKNPKTQVRQLKRSRIINQRQHDNRIRNELARGEQRLHDQHF